MTKEQRWEAAKLEAEMHGLERLLPEAYKSIFDEDGTCESCGQDLNNGDPHVCPEKDYEPPDEMLSKDAKYA